MQEKPKQYLYHMVPDDMEGDDILPLNGLKEKFPHLYELKIKKYLEGDEERRNIPNRIIEILNNKTWADTVQLVSVNPEDIKKALIDAGYKPREMKFYQIDPELLEKENLAVYLYSDDTGKGDQSRYNKFDSNKMDDHSSITDRTVEHYNDSFKKGEKPLLFVGVPHILHKGAIKNISQFEVITV